MVGLFVVDELLLLRIPLHLAIQEHGDVGHVAGVHGIAVRIDVGDGERAVLDALEEIDHVAQFLVVARLAAVELRHFGVEPFLIGRILLQLLDELAADAAAVDGQMALLAGDVEVVADAVEVDRVAVGQSHIAVETLDDVETIGQIGDRLLAQQVIEHQLASQREFALSIDLDGAGFLAAERP